MADPKKNRHLLRAAVAQTNKGAGRKAKADADKPASAHPLAQAFDRTKVRNRERA